MPDFKNQHFVPQCYLRGFAIDGAPAAINLLNLAQARPIQAAALKNQCSSRHFYGKDAVLEKAFHPLESAYGVMRQRLTFKGFLLTERHKELIRFFWAVQHLRTESALRRVVDMSEGMRTMIGLEPGDPAVTLNDPITVALQAIRSAVECTADLKICLIRNRTQVDFVAGDDPAVMTNRWLALDGRAKNYTAGMKSAGALLYLPLTSRVLACLYDPAVYRIDVDKGWVIAGWDRDIHAINELQYLHALTNVYFSDWAQRDIVAVAAVASQAGRPKARYEWQIFKRLTSDGPNAPYLQSTAGMSPGEEAFLSFSTNRPAVTNWPSFLRWREGGCVYSNGSAVGFVRKQHAVGAYGRPFKRSPAR